MKKYNFVWVLCTLMTVMTGCNLFNNTPNQPVTPTEPTDDNAPVAAYMVYSFGTDDDMLKIFNITLEYYDADGTKKSEKLKETSWSKRVETQSLPAKLGVRVLLSINSNYSINPYNIEKISYYVSYISAAINSEGKETGERYLRSLDKDQDCASDKILTWLESYSSHPSYLLLQYDDKGSATVSTSWE